MIEMKIPTIVDTSVWVDYFNGRDTTQTVWLEANISQLEMGLNSVILAELLQGASNDSRAQTIEEGLQIFAFHDGMSRLIATKSGKNYRFLRSKGITIRKTIDCLIATFCIENEYQLLHNDRDFDPFEKHLGLKVVHPEVV